MNLVTGALPCMNCFEKGTLLQHVHKVISQTLESRKREESGIQFPGFGQKRVDSQVDSRVDSRVDARPDRELQERFLRWRFFFLISQVYRWLSCPGIRVDAVIGRSFTGHARSLGTAGRGLCSAKCLLCLNVAEPSCCT